MSNIIQDKLQFFPLFLCVKFNKPKEDDFPIFSNVQATGNNETNELNAYQNLATSEQKLAFRRAVRYNLLKIKNDAEDNNIDEDLNCKWYLVSAKSLNHAKEKLKNCIYNSTFTVKKDDKEYEYSKNEYHIYFQTLEKNSVISLSKIQSITNPDQNEKLDGGEVYFETFVENNKTIYPIEYTINFYNSAKFQVNAIGINCDVSYQWQFSDNGTSWSNIYNGQFYSGAKTNLLTVSPGNNENFNERQFRCKIFNDIEESIDYSDVAQLLVKKSLINITSPESDQSTITAIEGIETTLRISAEGTGLTYQWQYKESEQTNEFQNITNSMSNYSGSTTNILTIYNPNNNLNGYIFNCIITDTYGTSVERKIILNVVPKDTLIIKNQTENITINSDEENSVEFFIEVESDYDDANITYQWFYYTSDNVGPSNCNSGINNTLQLQVNKGDMSLNGYKYGCQVNSDKGGNIVSDLILLTINATGIIEISEQPIDQTVTDEGETVNFSVKGSNIGTYQWQRKFTNNDWENLNDIKTADGRISGSTTSNLTLYLTPTSSTWDNTQYRCILTNSEDEETSNIATLTIT